MARAVSIAAGVLVVVTGLALHSAPGEGPPAPRPRSDYEFAPGELQSLREQYLSVVNLRVKQMSGEELQKGVIEMKRLYLMSELANLARECEGRPFEEVRINVAAAALNASSQDDLLTLLRGMTAALEEQAAAPK